MRLKALKADSGCTGTLSREDPFRLHGAFPVPQKIRRRLRKEDRADAALGFRFADAEFAMTITDRSADTQSSRVLIKVLPAESAELAAAQAGRELHVEQIVPCGDAADLIEEPLELFVVQHLDRRVFFLGKRRFGRRIADDQILSHSRIHRLVQHHVNRSHRAG